MEGSPRVSAKIIPFPTPEQIDAEDVGACLAAADERDCRNCVNARFGSLTYCTLVKENILDEKETARDCEAYEYDEEM